MPAGCTRTIIVPLLQLLAQYREEAQETQKIHRHKRQQAKKKEIRAAVPLPHENRNPDAPTGAGIV